VKGWYYQVGSHNGTQLTGFCYNLNGNWCLKHVNAGKSSPAVDKWFPISEDDDELARLVYQACKRFITKENFSAKRAEIINYLVNIKRLPRDWFDDNWFVWYDFVAAAAKKKAMGKSDKVAGSAVQSAESD